MALLVGIAPPALHAAPFAYIPNANSGTLSVIDIQTNTVTATVSVGSGPVAVAFAPDGSRAYIARGNNVLVFNTATNTVTTTIPVGTNPTGLAVTPDGGRVYAANASSNDVSVINTSTNTVVATVPAGILPQGAAITPDGTKVYVANNNTNDVSVIDTASDTMVATIPVGAGPVGVAVTPDGASVYVANTNGGSVSVISTAANAVTDTITDAGFVIPYAVAVTPDGARVYVTNYSGNKVSVISTASRTVSTTVPVGNRPAGIAVTADGASVYVINAVSRTVSVVSTASNTVTATIPVGNNAQSLSPFIAPTPPPAPVLTVTKTGSAASGVSSNPAGIDCGATCSASFASGSMVTLSATPASGFSFSGWSGACSGAATCSVTMNGNQMVTANFAPIPVTQSITFGPVPVIAVGSTGAVTATGGGSGNPVTFTSLTPVTCSASGTNGATITGVASGNCVIAANQAGAAGYLPASQVTQNIAIIPAGQPLALLGVQSRKNHGSAGLKDLPIDTTATIDGAVSVEPRAQAGGTRLVFQFSAAVTAVGPVTVSDEASVILDATVSFAGNEVTVALAPVADNKRVHVSFASINGIPVDADVSLGLLRGDANASRTVNAADVAVAKSRAGHVIDDNSVRYDINASGLITAADIAAIKARSAANVPFTPIVAPAIANVTIEQTGVLLSQVGASRQLVAKVTDALGRRLNVPVTWSSSRPANIAVDTNGLATASSLSGVTQIVASAGGVSSAPLLAMATAPASGAILLEDEQIVGDPVETNASAPPSVSNTYKVTLTGAPPAVGSLLINTGSKMVAGRVMQVDGSNPAVVTLGLVTLREMFPSLDIEETMDMSQAPVGIASEIAASYDVARSGNTFTFTPKAGAMQSGNAKAASVPDVGAKAPAIAGRSLTGPTGTRALPPFSSCETSYTGGGGEGAPLPIALSAPPLFSVSVSPTLDFSYKFTAPQGIERFIVNAEPTIKVEGGINISAAFEGKIECKSELFAFRIPVGGPLALIIGGLVQVGVGIEAGGKMTVATMGIGTKAEVKAKVKAGIVCPGGGFTCSFDNALTDFEVKVTPTIDTPSIGDIRLEPSLSAFGYLEAAVGNPILKSIRFDFIKVKAGAELAGSFALKESQLADAAYQSDYKLSLKASAGAGGNLSGALTLLGLTSVNALELSVSTDLAKSPAGLAAGALVADKSTFTAGEIVNFTVKLDPATLDFFPVVGPYNVKKVQLVRKTLGVATVVDTINANPGEDTFNFTYIATNIGNAGEFSAFVVTWLLPLDLLALEVGTASVVLKDSLATGRLHSCALTASRGVKCWGNNEYGQLGDGSNASRSSAVDVVGLSTGVAAIAAGANHTCALKTDGGMMCWGANGSGQLGDNTKVSRNTPTAVVGLTSGVAAIAPGAASSCALTTGGAVKCWGNNSGGELGDGTYVNRILPGNVGGLASGVTAISAGAGHTCALIAGGGVKCWAYSLGFEGPAPDFKDQFQTTPGFVSGVSSGITAIAASANAAPACALTTGGAVKCWNLNGLTPPPSYSINGLSGGVAAISVGGEQLCALTTAGGLKCGSATNATAPADVMGLTSGVIGVSAGGFHTCARIAGGGVKCWGYNFDGQIGNGTNTDSAVPVSVVGFP